MGRRRETTPTAVLNAVGTVVLESGAASLSLDSVASAAGVTKANILYGAGTRRGLLERFVSYASESQSPDLWAAAVEVCAAHPRRDGLSNAMAEAYGTRLAALKEEASDSHAAIIAFLAVEGLRLLEQFDFLHLDEASRTEVINAVSALSKSPE